MVATLSIASQGSDPRPREAGGDDDSGWPASWLPEGISKAWRPRAPLRLPGAKYTTQIQDETDTRHLRSSCSFRAHPLPNADWREQTLRYGSAP